MTNANMVSGIHKHLPLSAVAFAKLKLANSPRLIGRTTAGAGSAEEISIGTGLTLAAGVLTNSVSAYTDEMAQDAVGGILLDTSEIDFTYDDPTPSISAVLKADSVVVGKLHSTATTRLFGRSTAAAGPGEEISIGTGLTLAAGVLASSITQYTDEMAEDAVGGILTDTAEVNFTYNDAGNQITADLIDNSIAAARSHFTASPRLHGRTTAGAGAGEEISIGTGLTLAGGVLSNSVVAPVGANPSGTIGLAAVNGVAATFMRSDAAPSLSVAIAPTWTGNHVWSTTGSTPPIIVTSSAAGWMQVKSTASVAPTAGYRIGDDGSGHGLWDMFYVSSISGDPASIAYHGTNLIQFTGGTPGALFNTYMRVGSLTVPTNVTAGDFSSTRGFFSAAGSVAFGTNERLVNLGGFFKTSFNTATRPDSDNSNGGMAASWNYTGGSAEVDLWSLFDNGNGFVFKQKTGAATHADLATLDLSGRLTLLGGVSVAGDISGAGVTWTPVAYAAGNFTASSGTWTVDAGDQSTFAYVIIGKTMIVAWKIDTSTVAGGPQFLNIKIPASKTANRTIASTHWLGDNSAFSLGLALVAAGGTIIQLGLASLGAWAASTNASYTYGQIIFEIQ